MPKTLAMSSEIFPTVAKAQGSTNSREEVAMTLSYHPRVSIAEFHGKPGSGRVPMCGDRETGAGKGSDWLVALKSRGPGCSNLQPQL